MRLFVRKGQVICEFVSMYHHGTRSRDSQAFSRLNCSLDHLCSKYLFLAVVQKCFVFIPCFIGRFYKSGNECNWTNTEQLVFTKPCPQKEFMKTWKYVFHAFQFRLNLSGTEPQFAEIFRYYFTEAEIIQNRGFRSTLRPLPFNVSGNLEFRAVKFYFRIPASI